MAIRDTIARAVAEPSIAWTEYQSRDDTISFYRFDPVALKRIAGDRLDGKPVIRRVQIHDMVTAEIVCPLSPQHLAPALPVR